MSAGGSIILSIDNNCGGGCPGGSVACSKSINDKSYYCLYYQEMLSYVASKIPLIHSKKMVNKFLDVY